MNHKYGFSIGFCLVVASACSKGPSATNEPSAATAAPVAAAPAPAAEDPGVEARAMFRARCAVCHGENGKGDGPGAAALNPKPRNYTDSEWQAKVTDEQIKKTILMGGAAVGKSPNMPANPDLEGKDAVVDELVKIVRAFKSP